MWTITGHHLRCLSTSKTGLDCRTTDVAATVNEVTRMEESLFIQFNPEGGKDAGGQQCLKDAANIFLFVQLSEPFLLFNTLNIQTHRPIVGNSCSLNDV